MLDSITSTDTEMIFTNVTILEVARLAGVHFIDIVFIFYRYIWWCKSYMAAHTDNMDEMMNIINTDTQFADGVQQDVDDGSQYLALEDNQENIVQENTGEVYIFIYI